MRRRLVVSYLVIAVFVLAALEIPLGVISANHELDNVRAVAERDAATLAAITLTDLESDDHDDERPDVDLDDLAARFEAGTGSTVMVVDRYGNVVALHPGDDRGDPVDVGSGSISSALQGERRVESGTEQGRSVEVATEPVVTGDGEIVGAVRVSVDARHAHDRIRTMSLLLAVFAAGVLVLVVVVGILIAGSVTRPLRQLTEAVRSLERGDLGARTVTGGPRELRSLGTAFNAMADRLAELIGSQRDFVADASHQLRTPLTALRLRLEAIDPTEVSATRSGVDEAIADVVRMTRMVEGLLALVRTEGTRPARVTIDVAEFLADRSATWEPLASEHDVTILIDVDDPGIDALDAPGHAAQVLDNLIDNALGVAPAASTITLAARRIGDEGDRRVAISVTDEGPGMSAEQREVAFDRFWQGTDGTGSAGLGLAISRQLARASGGELTLEDGPIGLQAVLVLDAAPTDP